LLDSTAPKETVKPLFRNETGMVRSGWRILATVVLLGVVVVLLNVGWKGLALPAPISQDTINPRAFMVFAWVFLAAAAGVILMMLRALEHQGFSAVALPFEKRGLTATLTGSLLGTAPVILLVLLSLVGGYGQISIRPFDPRVALENLLPMAIAGFAIAASEELVLRGYLLRQFSLGVSPGVAVVVTGVLFGLAHGGNPGANWQGVLYTAIGGVMMAILLFRCGSLWVLIGYHFGWNFAGSTVFGLELSGMNEVGSVFITSLSGSDWLTGGSYGFEASLPAVVCEVLLLSLVIFVLGRIQRRDGMRFT
jgi:membrane protease YdiL (CAAX protease family)